MFDRDLDEAEEQYQMALRNHLVHVDELIDLQNSRLRGLNEEFIRDTEIVKNELIVTRNILICLTVRKDKNSLI